MATCGVCKSEVKSQPHVKTDGTCSVCSEKLKMEQEKKK